MIHGSWQLQSCLALRFYWGKQEDAKTAEARAFECHAIFRCVHPEPAGPHDPAVKKTYLSMISSLESPCASNARRY